MYNSYFILFLLVFVCISCNTSACYGQSWTTPDYQTFKEDIHFDNRGVPVGREKIIFNNVYKSNSTIEECGYAYRYKLECGERVNDTFACKATYKQFLFRYTDANKYEFLKECSKAFYKHWGDAKQHICMHDGVDFFGDYTKDIGTVTDYTVYMNGSLPLLDQDFHYDKSCEFDDHIPIVLEGAIIAFLLIAACLITVFCGMLIGSIKEATKKKTAMTTQLMSEEIVIS